MTATATTPNEAPVEGPRCATHPDREALGACARCGNFYCFDERAVFQEKGFCGTCGALPEVDYLETFRLRHWGKRDSWAYVVGVSALAQLALAVVFFQAQDWLSAVLSLVAAANAVCYFLGLPFARYGLIVLNMVFAILNTASDPNAWTRSVIPIAVSLSVLNNTRNQLFFKVDVSQDKLKKAWDLYANNSIARTGFFLGLVGAVFPPLAIVGLSCSIIGLVRVNPNAHPPIGRKGMAIAGIVLSSIGLAWGLVFLLSKVL